MKTFGFLRPLGVILVATLFIAAPGYAVPAGTDIQQLFESMKERGDSAEDILVQLMENGVGLNEATGFTVANADSIGLSIAYAQAAVCLAPDQPAAQVVGQIAADSAGEAGRNAVQAGVVSALTSYAKGECRLLLDELTNASQAFADGGGDGGDGGGPPTQDPEIPVSESQ
jgi:hypothetical protein